MRHTGGSGRAACVLLACVLWACGDSTGPGESIPDTGSPDAIEGSDDGAGEEASGDVTSVGDGDDGPDSGGPDGAGDADVPGDVDAEEVHGPDGDVDETTAPDAGDGDLPLDDGPGPPDGDAPDAEVGGDGDVDPDVDEGTPGDCEGDQECPGSACTEGVCVDGDCVEEPIEGPCDDLDPCTAGDTCVDGACVPGERVCEDCTNGVDDDGDGKTDCEDEQCAGTFACGGPPSCDPLLDLPCGVEVEGVLGEAGSTNRLDTWGCGASGLDGPETAHRFVAPGAIEVDVGLEAPEAARLLVLDDAEACRADGCFASGEAGVAFAAEAGASYALVVDAPATASGAYTLSVACSGPEICDNGVDDDGDGLVDCFDADCVGEADCDGQLCDPGFVVGCDEALGGVFGAAGDVEASACGPTGEAGEAIVVFAPDVPTDATFTAWGPAAPRLFTLDLSDGCDTGACLDGGGDQVAVQAGGSDRAILVDSDASGTWELYANCSGVEARCDDGLDDDGDGATDCDDADCAGADGCGAACPVVGVVSCGSHPLVDVAGGSAEVSAWGCPGEEGLEGPEVAWRLTLPDATDTTTVRATLLTGVAGARLFALDGGAACSPAACLESAEDFVEIEVEPGAEPYLAVDTPAGATGDVELVVNCGGTEDACSDGIDGDGDGLTDCEDPDCAGVGACP